MNAIEAARAEERRRILNVYTKVKEEFAASEHPSLKSSLLAAATAMIIIEKLYGEAE